MALSTATPAASRRSDDRSPPTSPPCSARTWCVLALVLQLALATGGCRSDRQTPEEALRQFVSDVQNRRAKDAWAAISAQSRAKITEQAEAVAQAAGKKPPKPAAMALFSHLELVALRMPESASVVSPLGNQVMLRVSVEGGKTANLKMVLEDNRWKVDLLDALEPYSGAGMGTSTTAAVRPATPAAPDPATAPPPPDPETTAN